MKRGGVAIAGLTAAAWMLSACHSSRIVATVENRTGGTITLVEVDYPSASFGVDALAAGADFPYRFKVQNSGIVKVQYTAADGRTIRQISGPALREGQEGTLTIVLRPDGTAEFQPKLSPAD
jgi:hypothetical protein